MGDYKYTIPRGPIAAMYSSPGPCYGLPGMCGFINQPHDPRSTHTRKPAYTFGFKSPIKDHSVGPGPKYMLDPKMYRDGRDGTPHYSLRPQLPVKPPFNTPAPNAYSPEKGFPRSEHITAPCYSIHHRLRGNEPTKTPAPNRYTLPSLLGDPVPVSSKPSAPKYTMRPAIKIGRFDQDLAKAPGPGTYNETLASIYKQRPPIYSMAARVFMPGDNSRKPGPGAHRPEDVKYGRQAPCYSFGIRHTQYKTEPMMEPKDIMAAS